MKLIICILVAYCSNAYASPWNEKVQSLRVKRALGDPCCATVYPAYINDTRPEWIGREKKVCGELADLGNDFQGAAGVSAIVIDRGCVAEAFHEINYGGGSNIYTTATGPQILNDPEWNDKIKSLKVRPDASCCATLYPGALDDPAWKSGEKKVCGEVANVGDSATTGQGISSIGIDEGCYAQVFSAENYGGETKIYQQATELFHGAEAGWNDKIKSLKVRRA